MYIYRESERYTRMLIGSFLDGTETQSGATISSNATRVRLIENKGLMKCIARSILINTSIAVNICIYQCRSCPLIHYTSSRIFLFYIRLLLFRDVCVIRMNYLLYDWNNCLYLFLYYFLDSLACNYYLFLCD